MKQWSDNHLSYFAISITLVLLLISGCKKENTAELSFNDQSNIRLKSAESSSAFEKDIKTYFTKMLEKQSTAGNSRTTSLEIDGMSASVAESHVIETTADTSETINVSGTNLMEFGVDEADLVKTDGIHLFIAQQKVFNNYAINEMFTTIDQDGGIEIDSSMSTRLYEDGRSKPASIRVMSLDNETPEAIELTKIVLPKRVSSIVGLYLSRHATDDEKANQLIAVTRVNVNTQDEQYFRSNNTWVIAYDVSTPETPVKQWEFEVEGFHHASRSMNGNLYLIASKSLWIDALNLANNEPSIIHANKALIAGIKVQDVLPTTWVNGIEKTIVKATDCMVPEKNNEETVFSANLLAVYTIPTDAPEKTQSFCTLESSSEIYASTHAIYFTKGEYVPSNNTNTPGKYYTVIHKLKFTEDNVAYQSSARVPGWTGWRGNTFRLSELNHDLRIVVTEYETTPAAENANGDALPTKMIEPMINFERRPVHRLYVLREDPENDNLLSILSHLPNKEKPEIIGKPGEEIYAVRYFGEYAYIVTFQRTDPLYAINLKDPAAPFIEGELSIPGFSNYLHPINNNLLLGIGKEATNEGVIQGIKISLFDVSDKSQPVTLKDITIGKQGSDSALNYDYRAFSILSNKETGIHKIALPISVNDTAVTKNYGRESFTTYQWSYSGLQLLEIDDGSQSSIASMNDAGAIKAIKSTTINAYHYARDPRSVIANDAIHYIDNSMVWSAMWERPDEVNGPN